MTTPAQLECICGHLQAEHPGDGACQEPTHRCICNAYAELCPKCRHAKTSHDGPHMGDCTRIVQKTGLPCGCPQYAGQTLPEPPVIEQA